MKAAMSITTETTTEATPTREELAHELMHAPRDAQLAPLGAFCAVMIGQDVLSKAQAKILSELALWDQAIEVRCSLFSRGVVYVSIRGARWFDDSASFTIGRRGAIRGEFYDGRVQLKSLRDLRYWYWSGFGGQTQVKPKQHSGYGRPQ